MSNKILTRNLKGNFNPNNCLIINGDAMCDGEKLDYETDGESPTSGIINLNRGVVTGYSVCTMGYKVVESNNNVTVDKGSDCIEFNGTIDKSGSATHRGIVYLNPKNLGATCNYESSVSTTGTHEGCMKFYIFDDSGDNYKMILDHNTSGNVSWNSSGVASNGMNEVAIRLSEDTNGWLGSPRLITANEVAHIVGADRSNTLKWDQSKVYNTTPNIETQVHGFYLDGTGTTYSTSDGWSKQVADSTNKSNYAWLYDNLYICEEFGCNKEDLNKYPYPNKDSTTVATINGYWTSSVSIDPNEAMAWLVSHEGRLGRRYIIDNKFHGVRPVITIPKSIIDS